MNQFLFFPGTVQRFGDLLNNGYRFIGGKHFLAFQHRFHGFAINIFHGKIENAFILADGVGLNYVRMVQFGSGTRFLDEVDDEFRVVSVVFLKNLYFLAAGAGAGVAAGCVVAGAAVFAPAGVGAGKLGT